MLSFIPLFFTLFFSIRAQNSTTSSQSLLPVPAYPTASSSSYSNTTAKTIAVSLPPYTYNLTSESLATRVGICNQTTSFCSTSACDSPVANVTTNFCNVETMGYNCACDGGASSRLLQSLLTVPVNSFDCKFRSGACLAACEKPTIPSLTSCQNACMYILSSTCGTNQQVIPEYRVEAYSDVPKYYPDTSKGGVALGVTTSGASHTASSLFSLLLLVLVVGITN